MKDDDGDIGVSDRESRNNSPLMHSYDELLRDNHLLHCKVDRLERQLRENSRKHSREVEQTNKMLSEVLKLLSSSTTVHTPLSTSTSSSLSSSASKPLREGEVFVVPHRSVTTPLEAWRAWSVGLKPNPPLRDCGLPPATVFKGEFDIHGQEILATNQHNRAWKEKIRPIVVCVKFMNGKTFNPFENTAVATPYTEESAAEELEKMFSQKATTDASMDLQKFCTFLKQQTWLPGATKRAKKEEGSG
jgi:hypothetical protein